MKLKSLILAAVATLSISSASAGETKHNFNIVRDDFGVPHVYAESNDDLYRGEGYVLAQDRLWQLETFKRAANGTMSSIFGEEFLPFDKFRRRHNYTPEEYHLQYLRCNDETRIIIDAYVSGVNAWVQEVRKNREMLPYEFWQRGIEPVEWNQTDLMNVITYFSRMFGSTWGQELEMLAERDRLGQEEFNRLYPINDPSAPVTIRLEEVIAREPVNYHRVFSQPVEIYGLCEQRRERQEIKTLSELIGLPKTFGSFGVAVSPDKSADGYAMLIGGPQPEVPYEDITQCGAEVGLHSHDFDVVGYTIPGLPGVIVGRNNFITWTFTSGLSDNVDLYIEELNPLNPDQYLFNGKWINFETRTDTILVYDTPKIYTFKRSIHGPIDPIPRGANQAFSYKRTYWNREIDFLESLTKLNKAKNLDEVHEALALNPMSWNVLCAARNCDIGYWHIGFYQDRLDSVDPRLPHKGTGEEEWHGIRSFNSLPHARNPKLWYFANWNNKPSPDWDNGDNMKWVGWNHVQKMFDYLDPINPDIDSLKRLQYHIGQRGCYEQVVEWSSPLKAFNILPPGQSGFIDMHGIKSIHYNDQWEIYARGDFKTWEPRPWHIPEQQTISSYLHILPVPSSGEFMMALQFPEEGNGSLKVYDSSGRLVKILQNNYLSSGQHILSWDGVNEEGKKVSSGVYFVRAEVCEKSIRRKIVITR